VQQKIHDPANYFFNFNLTRSLETPVIKDILTDGYKDAGIVDSVKVVHVPKAKNLIHLRLENLADLYDSNAKNYTIDLEKLANSIWLTANAKKPVDYKTMEIKEMSLTGNMEI
jgi:hypothetical protein